MRDSKDKSSRKTNKKQSKKKIAQTKAKMIL